MQKLAIRSLLGAYIAALALAGSAQAQVYPSRPVTLVAPFAAGGATDTLARVVAEGMKTSLGQPVIVEDITGAAGSIAVGKVARAPEDGYTLVLGNWATYVVNGAVFPLHYDLLNDFAPVSLVATQPLVIIANKNFPANNLNGLLAWLKANPGKATMGTAGVGSATHIAGIFFQNETGARFQFVPYRGGGSQAMQDLLGGRIDLLFTQASNAVPHLRSGALKAFAVTADKRLATAPDIPTVDEAGLPGLHISNWHAIWAPKGTPKDIIAKLNAAVAVALADPAVRQRLADLGQEIFPPEQQTPKALAVLHNAEIEKWWPIIKAANLKAE
jgi:tripartite-type tricarboxylate transporter receptor subunit TctC